MTTPNDNVTVIDQRARDVITGPDDLGRTLFVEAGAGSGKTRALVERVVQLVLTDAERDRTRLSSIAAITFTEAAAAELRERIRATFEARLRAAHSAGDEVTAQRCVEALDDADVAAICTLHAFAQRLLSEYPVEVGIPPRVDVVDEVQSQVAFDVRWSDFVDELHDDPELEDLIVRAALLDLRFGQATSPLRQLAQIFDDNWDRLVGLPDRRPTVRPIDWIPMLDALHAVDDERRRCTDPSDGLAVKLDAYEFRAFASASTNDRIRMLSALASVKPGVGRKDNWGGDVESAREVVRELVERAQAIRAELTSEALTGLADRIARFTVVAAKERRAEGRLEFHDLLVLARRLLRSSAEARDALADRYRVLMLDEFQDTDPIQTELALLLTSAIAPDQIIDGDEDVSDLEPRPGRLFMVGDPKQSIYRFRRADIDLFLRTRNRFDDGRQQLVTNFRTVPAIIDFVNAFFAQLMPEETETQPKYAALVPHRTGTVDHRPVVFGTGAYAAADDLREREAKTVGALISDIVESPDRWKIDDKGIWRLPRLADITILLPTRSSLSQLTAALDDLGIAHRADTGTLVYETQEVRDVVSAMRAVDDASDQIALVAALRSPLYGCSDDDLVWWASKGGVFDHRVTPHDELAESPVAAGLAHLADLAEQRWWLEPSQLLQRLIDERMAFAVATCGSRPRDVWRRLRFIVDQARAFAESGGGDLRDWLRWVALQGADGSRAHEPMLDEPDDDAVRIMTIHGSKGLEFPITIISGMTTQPRSSARGANVRWNEAGSLPEVSISSSTRTSRFDERGELEEQMDTEEKDRLLYVALTRARDHLLVSSYHATKKDGTPYRSHGGQVAAFVDDGPVGDRVRRVQGMTAEGILDLEGLHRPDSPVAEPLSLLDDEPEAAHAQLALTFDASTDTPSRRAIRADAIIERATTLLASGEPFLDDYESARHALVERAKRRQTVSATGVAGAMVAALRPHDVDDDWSPKEHDDDAPSWDDYDDAAETLPPQTFRRGRAGTAIGTAVHAVLQHLDLTAPDDEAITALARSQAWVESVPDAIDTIEACVRSALQADPVTACREARHWKELYVAAPIEGLTIEGYIDLLVEDGEGLIVVDYKTDTVRNEADVDAKLDRYGRQGAAYAYAVEQTTGRPVTGVAFVFARPDGPIVRHLDELDAAKADIQRSAEGLATGSLQLER